MIEKEAAEKAVEAMMVGLYDTDEEEQSEKKNDTKAEPEFEKIQKFSVVFSLPSTPNDVKLVEKNCTTEKEAQNFYEDVKGLKMIFTNGLLYKSNILLQDNEFEYYRLIGEAYN